MDYVFSQNVERFSGANATQMIAYQQAFAQIGGDLRGPANANRVIAAGFQEITNAGNTATHNLALLAQNLDPNMTSLEHFWIGRSAFNFYEWLAITYVPAAWNNLRFGVVMYCDDGAWRLADRTGTDPGIPFTHVGGVAINLDYRGVAYISGTGPAGATTLGFVHNVRNIADNGVMLQSMPRIFTALQQVAPGATVYVGGDFNVPPVTRRGLADNTAYAVFAPEFQNGVMQTDLAGIAIPERTATTECLDYYFSSLPLTPTPGHPGPNGVPAVRMHPETRGWPMSVHAGVSIVL